MTIQASTIFSFPNPRSQYPDHSTMYTNRPLPAEIEDALAKIAEVKQVKNCFSRNEPHSLIRFRPHDGGFLSNDEQKRVLETLAKYDIEMSLDI